MVIFSEFTFPPPEQLSLLQSEISPHPTPQPVWSLGRSPGFKDNVFSSAGDFWEQFGHSLRSLKPFFPVSLKELNHKQRGCAVSPDTPTIYILHPLLNTFKNNVKALFSLGKKCYVRLLLLKASISAQTVSHATQMHLTASSRCSSLSVWHYR